MTTQERFNRIWDAAYAEAKSFQVIEPVALRHAWATALMWYWYGADENERPDIISGFRSPARQTQLLQRWKAGVRDGIAARPACRSWHMTGAAIDVEDKGQWLDVYGWLMQQLGMRWGVEFGDPNHFDYPAGSRPPNICAA